jgi:hypothetical protein
MATKRRSRKAAGPGWRPSEGLAPAFVALITEFTNSPRVSYGGRGFGARALRVDGRIFAMLDSKGRFVVKLPRTRADDLHARGQAIHFEPVPGRPMKEWLVVTDVKASWLALAREAHQYVANL